MPFKKQNPIAKELRTPKYQKRVVEDKTKYNRKKKKDDEIIEEEEKEDERRRFGDHLWEIAAVEKFINNK